ncbi:MAG: Hcp family type VI secretion system effector [Planctomycetota bacterium]
MTDNSYDAFLKIDGIQGESSDDRHANEIELLAYHHGLSHPVGSDASSMGSHSAGRCHHQEFTVTKGLDLASPNLSLYCSTGKHIPEVVLSVHRAGGDKVKYYEVVMSDVLITRINPYASPGHAIPQEDVSFTYGKIVWKYTKTSMTGQAQGDVTAGYDLVKNKAV